MTLTEQMKKGKLPFGRYYIKDINDEIFVDNYTNNGFINGFEDFFDDEIKEVLAPVPSYEEYSRLEWYAGCGPDRIVELNKENRQLKELYKRLKDTQNLELEVRRENQQLKNLLKECKYELRGRYTDVGWEDWSLINKIDNAIGEK